MSLRLRALSAVVAGASVVAGLSIGATSASAATATGGHTTITVPGTLRTALHDKGFTLSAASPATYSKGVLSLTVHDGTATPPNYRLTHVGRIVLTRAGKKVVVRNLVYRSRVHQMTGDIGAKQGVVVFVVGDPNRGNGGPHFFEFAGYSVDWSNTAVGVLDSVFGTAFFDHHRHLGAGDTTVTV